MHIIELHRAAVRLTTDAATAVRPGSLRLPTPCADWDVAALLEHMTVENHAFAAAARGREPSSPVDYPTSAEDVLAAFAEPGVLERDVALPTGTVPGARAVAMHTVDSVLHAWDLARALGLEFAPAPELVRFTTEVGEQIPDGSTPVFAARVPVPDDASPVTRMLALYGRTG